MPCHPATFVVALLTFASTLGRAALPATGNLSQTNLVAWCIVPFDTQKRGPEARAEMLQRLGISRLAYDWRSEHVPTFDAEVAALAKRRIELTAWWFPAALNSEARAILDCLARHQLHPQLWVTMGTESETDPAKLEQKIAGAIESLAPICTEAARVGSVVGLYNHLGWFGEPPNQLRILDGLRRRGHANAGIVYNFHHGHAHIDQFPSLLQQMKPHLIALNLNGMVWEGDKVGRKIIPLGTGDEELAMLQALRDSGWTGPVGILGHTEEDAEVKLRKELAGLNRLAPLIDGPRPARPVRPPPRTAAATSSAATAPPALGPGRHGRALDATTAGVVFATAVPGSEPPLTVECWARLRSSGNFNILVASEPKASRTHWELYTYAGAGDLSLYVPGRSPSEIRSGVNVCDNQWHHLAAHLEPGSVSLYVDGRRVASQSVSAGALPPVPNRVDIGIGTLVERGIGCDGQVDEVRLSRGRRPLDAVPSGPAEKDESTVALWHFDSDDDLRGNRAAGVAATAGAPNRPAASPTSTSARAAGEPAISGREPGVQGEADWVDNRWQDTDKGGFLASVLATPSGTIAKGLSIRLDASGGGGGIAYDTAACAFRAAWAGGFLKVSPSRFGLIDAPKIDGTVLISGVSGPGWPGSAARLAALHRNGDRVVLELSVDGTQVFESPAMAAGAGAGVFRRSFDLAAGDRELSCVAFAPPAANTGSPVAFGRRPGLARAEIDLGGSRQIAAVVGDGADLRREDSGRLLVTFAPSASRRRATLWLWHGPADQVAAFEGVMAAKPRPEDVAALAKPGPALWKELSTRGERGADSDILAVDTLTAPYDNPWKALLFFAGVDVAADGTVYTCTIHGDVWKVTGVDAGLRELRWKRYATGLFQPLGLKVRDNTVYVLGRDRITRLHDDNHDGEADRYESFFDDIDTSTGGHDYVTCLEQDRDGNFYYVDPKGVHRVSPDGKRKETVATGWRNPNGMGVSPDGSVITVAPQQGTWTPSSVISEARPGGYYGYGGPKTSAARPLGYDPHLCWIPHSVDNSSGSQVWIPEGVWGPFGGQMLHLLWGRSTMMLVLRDTVAGVRQGAVVPLPVKFQSGPDRASFNANDGSLLVCGSTGWQTNARKDGAVHRVRYTARPVALPVSWHAESDALVVRFSQPLDKATAEDPGSYGIKQWNYRYAADYGSKDWSVADPSKEGRDNVDVKSARLLPDGKSVRLAIPGLRPVMQMEVKYNIDGAAGARPLRGQFWLSINQLDGASRVP